jgi:hypothetical protein
MKLSTTILLFLMAVATYGAKKPEVIPTEEQMRTTYAAGVEKLTALARNPTNLEVDPIEKARFFLKTNKKEEKVEMWIGIFGQNSYGAMIRSTAVCDVWFRGGDILGNKVFCISMPSR